MFKPYVSHVCFIFYCSRKPCQNIRELVLNHEVLITITITFVQVHEKYMMFR